MNTLTDEILSAIDNVDGAVMESEINVINTLNGLYNKSYTILEYSSEEDCESFEMFQESSSNNKFQFRQTNKNGKKENIIMSVLKLIPRLIRRLIDLIKKKFGKSKSSSSSIIYDI